MTEYVQLVQYGDELTGVTRIEGAKMPYSKQASSIAKSWMEEALKLGAGEELFIPCDTKSKQNSLKTSLYGARKEYAAVDPVGAESITFSPVYRDGAPYIRVYKSKMKANLGFKKMADGSIQEIAINVDKYRARKILIMIKDHADLEQIEKIMGDLSAEERKLIELDKK